MHTGPSAEQPVTEEHYDLIVCGGGLAGFCAAVAAARLGASVCLVQDRPVLGGNSSSEVRVVPRGSTTYHAYAREGGVLMEAMAGERAVNHEPIFENGWTNSVWDLELYDIAQRTESLTLRLNTIVTGVETAVDGDQKGATRIVAIEAFTSSAERHWRLSATSFLDATGDGVVAAKAGCEVRIGTEARAEFDEPHATEHASGDTMGSSLHFKTKDVGHPVDYRLPEWAHSYDDPDFFYVGGRRPHDVRGGFWWIELGVPWDTIADNEDLRHELTRHTLGVWDWMKNKDERLRGRVENLALDWIGQVPGKRESRRIMGLHLMTEHDLTATTPPADEIAYGGWNIDLHTPGGLLAPTSEPTAAEGYILTAPESSSAYVGPFGIPLRSLIAKDVVNLAMAGRNVSATHVALGSVRVQSTTAMMGQAAGTAMALAWVAGVDLHEASRSLVSRVQQQLLKDGCFLVGVVNADPDDLGLRASVTASSEVLFTGAEPEATWVSGGLGEHRRPGPELLEQMRGQWIPVQTGPGAPGLQRVAVLLRNLGETTVTVPAVLRPVDDIWDYRPDTGEVLVKTDLEVEPGEHWVEWEVSVSLDSWPDSGDESEVRYLRLDLGAALEVEWVRSEAVIPGAVSAFEMVPGRMRRYGDGVTMSLRVEPAQAVYPGSAVTSGVARPHRSPNLWRAADGDEQPWIELAWDESVSVSQVHLTFPGHLLREYDRTPALWADPAVAADYRVLAEIGGAWVEVVSETGNVQPRRVHTFDRVGGVRRVRVEIDRTHGDVGMVGEVRVY